MHGWFLYVVWFGPLRHLNFILLINHTRNGYHLFWIAIDDLLLLFGPSWQQSTLIELQLNLVFFLRRLYNSIDKLFDVCDLPKNSIYWGLGCRWLLFVRFLSFLLFLNGDCLRILQLFGQLIWQPPYINDALVRCRYQLLAIIGEAHSRCNLTWAAFDERLSTISIKDCDCLGCAAGDDDGCCWVELSPDLELLRVSWHVIPHVLELRHLPHTQLPVVPSGHELSLLSYVHREYLTFSL